jgi:hypothetical protein
LEVEKWHLIIITQIEKTSVNRICLAVAKCVSRVAQVVIARGVREIVHTLIRKKKSSLPKKLKITLNKADKYGVMEIDNRPLVCYNEYMENTLMTKLSSEALKAAAQAAVDWPENVRCKWQWYSDSGANNKWTNEPQSDDGGVPTSSEHGCPAIAAALVDRKSCYWALRELKKIFNWYAEAIDAGNRKAVIARFLEAANEH